MTNVRSNSGSFQFCAPGDVVIMDNDATHKTRPIQDWCAKRPRWHVHFTPTGASWLNQVERLFALLTAKQLRRDIHRSTRELEQAILDYVDTVNKDPNT